MAGKSVILALFLVCQVICKDNDVRVVNVPPEYDQPQNLLGRKQINHLPETEITSEEDAENLQKPRETSFVDDTSAEDTTLETNSNSVAIENVLDANMPQLTQNFLDMEKKYVSNLWDGNLALSSEEERHNEIQSFRVADDNLASTSDDYDDVQVTEIPLDARLVENFLESERHLYLKDSDHEGLESMTFDVRSSGKESPSNVNVCGTVNLDKIVDELLDGLRNDIVKKGFDKIKIPDIQENFVKKVGIIEMKGYFHGEDGWAKNLSTIYRTDHVIATSHDNSLTVSCGFGLYDLQFGYDKYKAKFINIGPSGKLDVSVAKNSLLLNATVSWNNGTCNTTLDYLRLNKLGGFNMKITGLGPLNWLISKISDWIFKKFHNEIREKVETTLKEEIESQLKTFDCTQYLLGWQKYK